MGVPWFETVRAAPARVASATPARRTALWLAGAALSIIWFTTLGTRSLLHSDEGRYAAIALGMLESGDWVTPRLDGLLYFEKPPLQYWLGALSFHLFGVNEFAARLWPGLASFSTVLAVGCTGARVWGRELGVRALAIAAATTWIFGNGHFLTLDAGLTFFLTVVWCAALLAGHEARDATRRRWVWLGWAAVAGAVLSKGLIGVLIPLSVLLLYSAWQRDWRLWRRLHWASGLAILLALAAPWFVLVELRNPGFASFFFVHEHFARYLTDVHRRDGAWWFFVPMLVAGLLPWTGALPWLLQRSSARSGAPDAPLQAAAHRALLVWCGFVFLFFSASSSKLPSYILPMFPALALLIALRLRDVSAPALRRHLLLPTLVWLGAALASTQMARYASSETPLDVLLPLASCLRLGALLFVVGAIVAWWQLGRGRVTAALLGVAFGHIAALAFVMQGHDAYAQLRSAAPIAAALRPLIDERTPVFAVGSYDHTLPFYLRRTVVLVDYVDEFEFGQQREPQKSIPTLDGFAERWHTLPDAAAYMTRGTWRRLDARGVPMRIVYEDARRLVVVKP